MRDQHNNNNNAKSIKSHQENNSFDLWNFQGQKKFDINQNDTRGEIRQVQSYASSRYKPQLSMPSKPPKDNQQPINQSKREINKKPQIKQSSLPKKKVGNTSLGIIDYNPDSMVKYLKNKFKENNSQPNIEHSNQVNQKKQIKETDAIGNSLYQKKVLSNDYEMQKQIKKVADEEKTKQELSQCTFKPKLYSNQQYDKNKDEKEKETKNIYEKQSKWLDSVNTK